MRKEISSRPSIEQLMIVVKRADFFTPLLLIGDKGLPPLPLGWSKGTLYIMLFASLNLSSFV